MEKEARRVLVEMLLRGDIGTHRLNEHTSSESDSADIRREYLKQRYGIALEKTGSTIIDLDDAGKRNIENPIGGVQVPVGYIELAINGTVRPIFLATTEGKLVAGANRGASAINMCGGATAKIIRNSMARSLAIETDGIGSSFKVAEFVRSSRGSAMLETEFASTTSHGKLTAIDVFTTGRLVYIRYSADTKAAMGMNLVTIAATHATRVLMERLEEEGVSARIISESGNVCTDKKPAMINMIMGRGISIVAEAMVSSKALARYFKVDAGEICAINYVKNYVGSGLAGANAHNAQAANLLAATFLAYGQDIAQIVDGVNVFDDTKAMPNGGLYISVYLPSLEIGTFGGGTARETQKELLRASAVHGEGDETGTTKERLAELIAGAVLAGELNLLAAEAGNELASAHKETRAKRG